MKKLYSLFISILIALSIVFTGAHSVKANAVSIDDYYKTASTSSGEALARTLHDIIKSPKVVSYKSLWSIYDETDVKVGKNGDLVYWDMYSNVEHKIGQYSGGNASEGAGMNKEHSIPQSWFNEASPMVSDAFHVYPTDCYVNNMRSSYPFGEVSNPKKTSGNGSKLGPSSFPGYSGTVFEPIDEYKGDFARTYFYFALCYSDKISGWSKGEVKKVFSGSYPYLTQYSIDLFTKWHNEDPVSEKEIARNEAVYNVQKNRNPFIDHPDWSTIIWGGTYGGGSVTTTYSVNYLVPEGATFNYRDTQRYEANNTITLPTVEPTKFGYTFEGWYKDQAYTTKWNFDSDKITTNTTLYARMNLNSSEIADVFKNDVKMQVALGINYSKSLNDDGGTGQVVSNTATFGFKGAYTPASIDPNSSFDMNQYISSPENVAASDLFDAKYVDTGKGHAWIIDGEVRLYYSGGNGNKLVIKAKEGIKITSITTTSASSDCKCEVINNGTEAYIQATKNTSSKSFNFKDFTITYEGAGASYNYTVNRVELKARYVVSEEIYNAIIKGQNDVKCYMSFNDNKVLGQLVKEGSSYIVESSINVNFEDFTKSFNILGTIVIGDKTYTTKTINRTVASIALDTFEYIQEELSSYESLVPVLGQLIPDTNN
ncbi:MAG: endonuclease [Gammaproteobacteria bacterium]|nr:endonuclease [Gammaproteobacteria bacterium]